MSSSTAVRRKPAAKKSSRAKSASSSSKTRTSSAKRKPPSNGNGNQRVAQTTDWKIPVAIIIGIALIVGGVLGFKAIDTNDSSSDDTQQVTHPVTSDELTQLQDQFDWSYDKFRKTAVPGKNLQGQGRVIKTGLHGASVDRLKKVINGAALDKDVAYGVLFGLCVDAKCSRHAYNIGMLQKLRGSQQGSRVHYMVWRDLMLLFTSKAQAGNTYISGSWYNQGLSDGGGMGFASANYNQFKVTKIATQAQVVPGVGYVPASAVYLKMLCSNAQIKGPPSSPPRIPPPPSNQKDIRPLDNTVTGPDLHTDAEDQFVQADPGSVPGTSQGGDQGQDNGSGPGNGPANGTVTDNNGNIVTNPGCPSCTPTDTGQGAHGDSGPPG